jgi:hypothetical protein
MKTVTRLHFSRIARAARAALLIVVIAILAVMIVATFPRADDAGATGSEQNGPAEQPSHYNFPTYA